MDTSPMGINERGWTPRWGDRDFGYGGVWVVNWPEGPRLYVDFPVEAYAGIADRVSAMLKGWYFTRRSTKQMDWTVGAMWLVLGPKYLGQAAYVSGKPYAVTEIGYGSDPSAPEDAPEVELHELIRRFAALLDGRARPTEILRRT